MHTLNGEETSMRPAKILLLVESYFQQRDYRRYGVETMLANGFEVEIWEVFRAWRRAYAESYHPPDPSTFPGLRHFRTMDEICSELERIRPSDAVLALIPDIYATAPIFRRFAANNIYFGDIRFASLPYPPVRFLCQKSLRSWMDSVYVRLPRWVRRTCPWRFLLLCGGENLAVAARGLPIADAIWTHQLDYDQILEAGRPVERERPRHLVFLDEYVPFHPDYISKGMEAPTPAEQYYPRLLALFDYVEQKLGLPIVIAEHPRANYDKHPDYFGGRRVVRGMTCALVRDAALVIAHCSTASNFAVAYSKPVLVVTSDKLKASDKGPIIAATAEHLGAPLVNVDKLWRLDAARLLRIDADKYASFRTRVIKRPGTPEKNTWQTFCEHLRMRQP